MKRSSLLRLIALICALSLIAASCSDDDSAADDSPTDDAAADIDAERPALNSLLADSAVPIAHGDTAQTDWSPIAGPDGPSKELGGDDLTYQHLGPAHFGIAISPEYPDGERVIWSNGGDRISKLDYDTLDVLAELPVGDGQLHTEEQADEEIASLDDTEGLERAEAGLTLATQYLVGLSDIYYLLDADNTLFVGGSERIAAYQDTDPSDPTSAIELRDEWQSPDDIGGNFVGANITYDGRIVMVTDEGWVVAVESDFSSYEAIQLEGAEEAPAHNQAMADEGARSGAADWVRNSLAIDEDGGIYIVSVEHMHKVVWDGETLSTDPADGAWTEPYLSSLPAGSGATPSLMGFGDEDKFVVITDGEEVMNVVLFWREGIPEGWEAPAGAPSDRIAGQQPALIGDPDRASIQTEQSVVVAGYGAFVVNNDPASVPDGWPPAGTRVLIGHAGADPQFSPRGLQKFEWNPDSQALEEAWVNTEIGSANAVPIVSADLSHVYTVGAREGDWVMEGIDWETGESSFHWTTGSSRYNTLYSGMNLDEDGRIVHTTMFGIVRYEPAG
jgi:hypothetical protein